MRRIRHSVGPNSPTARVRAAPLLTSLKPTSVTYTALARGFIIRLGSGVAKLPWPHLGERLERRVSEPLGHERAVPGGTAINDHNTP
jgi:hypothetical protein